MTTNNIKFTSIQIHNISNIVPTTIVPSLGNAMFGILQIEANEVPLIKDPIFIVFNVDMSGSMSDRGKDGKTRMHHVQSTFENMIRFIASQDINVNICVEGFDDIIENIITPSYVTKHNVDELVAKVKTITPRNGTNIGLALQNASNKIKAYKKENPTHKIFHVLLTDGAATIGEMNPQRLSNEISKECVNIFLGIGSGHNTVMMQLFGNRKNAEYRFIDNGDNAGMVYGEILQRILRPAIEDVKIEMHNGEIYDWKTSSWKTTVFEDVIDSETTKTYHIRTTSPDNVEALIYGRISGEESDQFIRELDIGIPMPTLLSEDGTIVSDICDLTKYLYRQQTLEFLHSCSNFPVDDYGAFYDTKLEIRTKMADFFRSMRIYMRKNNIMHDSFMRTLCDDIVVAYRTVGTHSANMHCTSRNQSQGAQRSCTTQCDDDIVQTPPRMQRQNACSNINTSTIFDNDIDFDNIPTTVFTQRQIPLLNINTSMIFENDINDDDTSSVVIDEDDIQKYISVNVNNNFETSAYITPGRLQMMRAVSGRH